MKKSKTIRNTEILVLAALMTALSVIIGWFCKTYFTFGAIRLTFENLPVVLSGMAFGPWIGACVGIASDLISAPLSGFSPTPLITVGAAAVGMMSGFVSVIFKKRTSYVSFLLISMSAHAVGNMMIKSFALWQMGYALPLCFIRIPTYIVIGIIESYLIYIIYKNKKLASAFGGRMKK